MKFFSYLIICVLLFSSGLLSLNAQQMFPYGVASGDPLYDRVIIWTKVNPEKYKEETHVFYQCSLEPEFKEIVNHGQVKPYLESDYTIKIDVNGLMAGTSYYYRFIYDGDTSMVGKMRTASKENLSKLTFGVVSCNNFEDGFFDSFKFLAERDLDAIIHLGDYIYENSHRTISAKRLSSRKHVPAKEVFTLEEYRQRYAQYRKDPHLMYAHQMHTFITIWDDHESSNNSYTGGADNHKDEHGSWEDRLNAAKKAYFEWMPIRENDHQQIYRKISYGNFAELFLLDTRLEGRDKQIYDVKNDSVYLPERTILGNEQKSWLLEQWKNSKARWKLVGNQVIFSPLYVGHLDEEVENGLMDIWDGYPAERLEISRFILDEKISNVIFLTGDFHCSMAFEVPLDDWNFPLTQEKEIKNVAVEFVVPSITSGNFDEIIKETGRIKPRFLSNLAVQVLENKMEKESIKNKDLPEKRQYINPHLKYVNLRHHGFMVLEVSEDKISANYYLTKDPTKPQKKAKRKRILVKKNGENKILVTD